MNITTPLLIALSLIAVVWILIELKRFRHKMLAIFLIGLILTVYFSFTFVIREQDIDLKTLPGITNAIKLYFSWIGSVFGNFKTITSNAVDLKWGLENETEMQATE